MLKETRINERITVYQASRAMLNATVIDCGDYCIVVDTLHLPEDSRELKQRLNGKPVRYIINTHWHSDHCYGNRFLKDPHTSIIAHADYMDTITSERNVIAPQAKSILDRKNLVFPDIAFFGSTRIEHPVEINILHTPGHTMDSSVIYIHEDRVLIAGDTVLSGASDKVSVPYFYWGDSDIYLLSLDKLGWLDIDTIIPGHGDPADMGIVQQHSLYLNNLKKAFGNFRLNQEVVGLEEDKIAEMAFKAIPQQSCLPGTKSEDFWVPVMHELNIRKLITEQL